MASLIATYTYLSPACLAVSPVFSGLQQNSSWNCGSVAAKLDELQTNGTQQAGGDMCTCIYIYIYVNRIIPVPDMSIRLSFQCTA